MMKQLFYSIAVLAGVLSLAASPAQAACTAPSGSAGSVVYNTAQKVFQYCQDTQWMGMNAPGTGAGGCTAPDLSEGGIVYNETGRVLQGCAGSVHRAFGPLGGGAQWVKISASKNHACGVLNNGTLWCWGGNGNGQLGNGTTNPVSAPVNVPGNDFWIDVATGWNHTCGLQSSGRLYCWGERYGGKIGDGGTNNGDNQLTPSIVAGSWTAISAGEDTSCGIRSNGQAYCWGDRLYGRIGDGGASTGFQLTPALVSGGGTWIRITSGQTHSCGIKSDNSAWCWGSGEYRKTGRPTSTTTDTNIPINIFGGANSWVDIEAGVGHTCGIRSSGTLHCWGLNDEGQLGIGTTTNSGANASPQISGGGSWKAVSGGTSHSCGIKADNTLWCWGRNQYGELGNGQVSDAAGNRQVSPVAVNGGYSWRAVSAGEGYSCGITATGLRKCWGLNGPDGLLGEGSLVAIAEPAPVTGQWKQVSLWGSFTCAIDNANAALCWGYNIEGELGDEQRMLSRPVPEPVSGGGLWQSLASGLYHSCGIKADNTLWCWGYNTNGQLGINTLAGGSYRDAPVQVYNGGSWKMTSTSTGHSCGIKADNTLWCWGYNISGRLGNGNQTQQIAPVQIGSDQWLSIATGEQHSCGIKADQTGWCWGNNSSGAIGKGDTGGNQLTPIIISGGHTWKKIASGYNFNCGITTEGALYCWGYNGFGQLGDNTVAAKYLPTLIGSDQWLDIDVGEGHSCGIQADHTLWCWGLNGDGQLGDGTKTSRRVPTRVKGNGDWESVDIGREHSCGITRNDGKIYCWGYNEHGQLTNTEFSAYRRFEPSQSLCQGPRGKPGALVYSDNGNQLQYCDGAGWVSVGGIAPQPPLPPPPTAGLIAHWALDESTGSIAADSVGTAHGTLLGNPVWRPTGGRVGGALEFDGNGDTVLMGDLAVLEPSLMTVCVWARRTGAGDGFGGQLLVDKQHWDVGGYLIGLEPENTRAGWRVVSTGSADTHDISTAVTTNAWHHYCGVFDGTMSRLYVDGVEQASKAASLVASNTAQFRLGSNGGANYWFQGLMDDVRLYNRALSPEEIKILYQQ